MCLTKERYVIIYYFFPYYRTLVDKLSQQAMYLIDEKKGNVFRESVFLKKSYVYSLYLFCVIRYIPNG